MKKKANLPLPEKLNFYSICINKKGINKYSDLIQWSEICATGISIESILDKYGEDYRYINHLLVCLNNGKIIEFELGDISSLKGLLGHFIEEYKIEFKKNTFY